MVSHSSSKPTYHLPPIGFSVILLLFLDLSASVSATPGNETDKLALLHFKSHITDDPLGVLAAWNESLHFCQWFGVTCGLSLQRITSLNLVDQKLVGSISPRIGNLTFLQSLNISNNFFHGEIPPEVGSLLGLREFNLSYNLLQGLIPVNLSNCSMLTNLVLDQNYLMGPVPSELASLPELVILSLGKNNLTGTFPTSIGNLSRLQSLRMHYNNLEGEIPQTISQLRNLTIFYLGANHLSGAFPPSLLNMSSLQVISLTMNNFSGIIRSDIGHVLPNLRILALALNQFAGPFPAPLSNISAFEFLDIGECHFTGNVPSSFGNLQELQRLNLYGNSLGSNRSDDLNFITHLTNCSELNLLDLSFNRFGGLLPSSISNLSTQLTWLTFGGNNIGGRIPSEISNLINLILLDVDRNFLVGKVPSSIGRISCLQTLYLDRNQFTGEIPSSIGNITQLIDLHLEVNNFEGSIPSSLGNLRYIHAIVLNQNKLNGTIPRQIMNLSSLSLRLEMASNLLTGSVPPEVGNLINLVILDVSNNKLSGAIPNTIRNCFALRQLFLQDNFFDGTIPSLDQLKGLEYLDFSSNNLSGQIPEYLGTFSSLLNLNLSFNNLDGEVPVQGIFRNSSAVGITGNNRLCGGIPELHLEPCPAQAHNNSENHNSTRLILVILIPALLVALLVGMFLLCHKRKLRKASLSLPSLGQVLPRVSYQELLNATGGFSSNNMIGSGHFGSVYKGTLGPDGTNVAVKVLKLQAKGACKGFMAECLVLKTVRHRNLIKVLTACSTTDFQHNDFKAIVYELMPNGSLENWLHSEDHQVQYRKLNLLERINIAIDVASALNYLHNHMETAIVHCDLKPSNVLLDNNLIAHVSDFGLARLLPESARDALVSQFSSAGIKGTIGYAAPEYGTGSQVSKRGDVYSYGVLLLEMFTGKKPTDEHFKDDFNIRNFVERGLQDRLIEVADQSLFREETQEGQNRAGGYNLDQNGPNWVMEVAEQSLPSEEIEKGHNGARVSNYNLNDTIECLRAILEIGVSCTAEFPRDRMDIKDVEAGILLIRDRHLGTRRPGRQLENAHY